MSWTIKWPDEAAADAAGPAIKRLCELYSVACMTALTLHRVGGDPVTIMPGGLRRVPGHYVMYDAPLGEYAPGGFFGGTVFPSAADLLGTLSVSTVEALDLPGPVGAIVEVRIDGAALDPLAYRVENGRYLVRLDGGSWPVGTGDDFTVTYYNSYPPGEIGSYAAGVMAEEWLKLLTKAKGGCRLPRSVTNIQRQGLTMELARGMFPDGVTGMPEVDAYIMLLNPFALKVMPRVYSPDLPQHRQVTG